MTNSSAAPTVVDTPPAPKKSCSDVIAKHWTVTHKPRTAEQDAAEELLFTFYLGKNRYVSLPGVKFSRWYLFFAAFLIQFCIGSLYSWSVLNKPIDTLVYNNAKAEKAVNCFYTAVGVFGTTTAIMGPWIERNGPRAGVLLGTSTFFIGWMLCAISLHHKSIVGVFIGYGVFAGFGMGLCYISPVSALQKWFPDYRGTAAGFAVGGYGMGAVVWGKVYLPVIRHIGLSSCFVLVGCIMTAILLVCAIVLRSPHHEYTVAGLNIHGEAVEQVEDALLRGEKISVMSSHEYESIVTPSAADMQEALEPHTTAQAHVKKLTLIGAIKSVDFVVLYIMFFGSQLYGLIVLSKLSSMCVDLFGKSASEGADIVSINGIFNCVGRLLFPAISDAIIRFSKIEHAQARKLMYHFGLTCQVIIIFTIPHLIRHQSYGAFVALVFILTTCYGGGFGTIPCFLTDMFGAYNIGAMHGLILTAWSIGGVVGGITFNSAYRHAIATGSSIADAYITNIHKIFIVVVIAWFVCFVIRTNPLDRFAPGYRFSVFGKPVVNIKPKRDDKNELLLSPA